MTPAAPTISTPAVAQRAEMLQGFRLYLAAIQAAGWKFMYGVFNDWDWEADPVNILFTFHAIRIWKVLEEKTTLHPRYRMLDSGAFSAWNQTIPQTINIYDLIREANKPKWDSAVGLDVIGDWRGSKNNLDYMQKWCPKAFPVFHVGDPFELLQYYCEKWDVVGLSCRFGEPEQESFAFYEKCFRLCYPHRFHSFGWVKEEALLRFPFISADTSTWGVAPCRYGHWKAFGGQHLGTRDEAATVQGLKYQVRHFLELEQKIQGRWKKENERWKCSKPSASRSAPTFPEAPPLTSLSLSPGLRTMTKKSLSNFVAQNSRRSAPSQVIPTSANSSSATPRRTLCSKPKA